MSHRRLTFTSMVALWLAVSHVGVSAQVERLALTEARTRLRYQIAVEDPVYLTEPATLAQQWDYRPDLEFSPASEACDDDVAARCKDSLPE